MDRDAKQVKTTLENVIHKEKKEIHGCTMWVKDIPDPMEGISLDPRVYEEAKQMLGRELPELPPNNFMVSLVRMQPAYPNKDVSEHEQIRKKASVDGPNGAFDVWIYQRADIAEKKQLPCFIFFHGGAFFAGSTKVVENFCKAIADLSEVVVVNVEYHLAPETVYPGPMEDCYTAVNWVADHGEELGIDPGKLIISGDSAGGTLAIDCCLLERERVERGELEKSRIVLEALLYPAVMIDHHKIDDFQWSLKDYHLATDDRYAKLMVYEIGVLMNSIPQIYMGTMNKVTDPLAAPLHQKSLKGLPRTVMALSEFDYLRLSGEAFGRKMERDGVDHCIFLYKGMNHGFIDKIGDYPQAYDVAKEISKEIEKIK